MIAVQALQGARIGQRAAFRSEVHTDGFYVVHSPQHESKEDDEDASGFDSTVVFGDFIAGKVSSIYQLGAQYRVVLRELQYVDKHAETGCTIWKLADTTVSVTLEQVDRPVQCVHMCRSNCAVHRTDNGGNTVAFEAPTTGLRGMHDTENDPHWLLNEHWK